MINDYHIESHGQWFKGMRRRLSPNQDKRPLNTAVDLVVIHGISLPPGQFGGPYIEQLFTNTLDPTVHQDCGISKDLRVSTHILIDRHGQPTQFVALSDRAWHAGQSQFMGRSKCNDFSIGIELEGSDLTPYTDSQYVILIPLIKVIMAHWPAITMDRIVGHEDISPQRKTDPGSTFSWDRLRNSLARDP